LRENRSSGVHGAASKCNAPHKREKRELEEKKQEEIHWPCSPGGQ